LYELFTAVSKTSCFFFNLKFLLDDIAIESIIVQ